VLEPELFFRAKLEAMLTACGHELRREGDAERPALVIADVNRVRPEEVAARHPGVPILGYGQHTDPQALRAARKAGFARAVPRSVLVERLPQLVAELTAG
jgi:DNA-binding NarL/FixJ family response regulator